MPESGSPLTSTTEELLKNPSPSIVTAFLDICTFTIRGFVAGATLPVKAAKAFARPELAAFDASADMGSAVVMIRCLTSAGDR